jgi:hypothetical protein
MTGNMSEYDNSEAGVPDFKWFEQFGSTWKLNGGYGVWFKSPNDALIIIIYVLL